MTWGYVASSVGFTLAFVAYCAVGAWLWSRLDRAMRRYLDRHVDRALTRDLPQRPTVPAPRLEGIRR